MVRVPKEGYVVGYENGDGSLELYKQFHSSPFETYTDYSAAHTVAKMQNEQGKISGRTDWKVILMRFGEDGRMKISRRRSSR